MGERQPGDPLQYWLTFGRHAHSRLSRPTDLQLMIADLCTRLLTVSDSNGGFMAAIDRVLDHAEMLQKDRDYYRDELKDIERRLAVVAPPFKMEIEAQVMPATMQRSMGFVLQPQQPYRIIFSPLQASISNAEDHKLLRKMRWRTYLAFARRLRKTLDQAFAEAVYKGRTL